MPVTGLLASDWLRAVKRGGYMGERTKKCSRCGKVKPWSDYYPRRKDENGQMLAPRAQCKPCGIEARQEWARENRDRLREWRQENRETRRALGLHEQTLRRERERMAKLSPEERERRREYQREWVKRRRWSDPEWRAVLLARNRDWWKRKCEREGREYRPVVKRRVFQEGDGTLNHSAHTGLPIGPFREWLRDYFERERQVTPNDRNTSSGVEHVYEHIGLAIGRDRDAAARAVYRWLKETEKIPLDYADAVLTRLDSPARLYELWPELDGSDVACA